MDIGILFSGVLWLVPMILGLSIVGFGIFLSFFAKKRAWSVEKRLRYLRIGRALIPALPLSGICGTVWGLMNALLFMKDNMEDMGGVLNRFGTALNTTFWGVIFGFFAVILYEVQLGQMKENADAAE